MGMVRFCGVPQKSIEEGGNFTPSETGKEKVYSRFCIEEKSFIASPSSLILV